METAKHFETPWRYHLGRGKNPRFHVQTEAGYQIASTPEVSRYKPEAEAQETNIAFVVQACNLHDELVEAVRRILEWADCGCDVSDKAIAKARAVLAKLDHAAVCNEMEANQHEQ